MQPIVGLPKRRALTDLQLVLRRSTREHDLLFREDLVPLPSLETVDVVAVNHDRLYLVLVDLLNGATGLLAQGLPGVAQDKIDLARDGFRGLRVIACVCIQSMSVSADA